MSDAAAPKLTPMMIQYREAKNTIPPDAVLLFRLGDFYEEFFEDAETVSSVLELTLTKRQGMPMCGFPYHALDTYLPKLVAAGLKVAIAEQVEDPKLVTKASSAARSPVSSRRELLSTTHCSIRTATTILPRSPPTVTARFIWRHWMSVPENFSSVHRAMWKNSTPNC